MVGVDAEKVDQAIFALGLDDDEGVEIHLLGSN